MNMNGIEIAREGPPPSIPPIIPPWNMKERPSEKAASEIVRSLISVFEKCQNEPVCSVGAGLKA